MRCGCRTQSESEPPTTAWKAARSRPALLWVCQRRAPTQRDRRRRPARSAPDRRVGLYLPAGAQQDPAGRRHRRVDPRQAGARSGRVGVAGLARSIRDHRRGNLPAAMETADRPCPVPGGRRGNRAAASAPSWAGGGFWRTQPEVGVRDRSQSPGCCAAGDHAADRAPVSVECRGVLPSW